MDDAPTIAVFFDSENVQSSKVPLLLAALSSKGTILFQRAYADWSIPNMKSWKELLNKIPVTAIQQFHHDEKQAVDKLIIMDAIEMAIMHAEIEIFAIVSSDNGYHTLALRLRELGKRVIGFGEKSKCNPIWIKSCNEFSYLEDLEEADEDVLLDAKDKDDLSLKDFSLAKFVEKAFDATRLYKNTNTVLLSQLWESILHQKPDFNVREYNAKSPRELIASLSNIFKLSDDGKPQKTFFVEKIEVKQETERKDGVIKRWIQNYRIISADDGSGDYFFYMGEINPAFKADKLDKGTKVNFQVVETPNNAASPNGNGRATDVKVTG